MASHLPMEGDSSISLEEQSLNDLLNSYGFENPPDEFILYSFTLCDITRDGQKELALYSQFQSGLYCVLHREGDTFYGVYMPIRWFQGLQKNGIFGVPAEPLPTTIGVYTSKTLPFGWSCWGTPTGIILPSMRMRSARQNLMHGVRKYW